ncbi:T9SS type A sorting domain-containing protein [Pseudoflavitalea rhizosphaerae]|uniref:T9SS type A sorting domain-containing protein n=1 Tax=Pseudoflavitalea rhizosphaerae TaxID=1884793 RepID=UPI000F8D9713|nr:T9SS type A sorting domain-containing protein [Pseudoflavitalea rhizosphaerae]
MIKLALLKTIAWIFVIMSCALAPISAQTLFSESFNYTGGTPLTSNNWTVRSSGTPVVNVAAGNLSYSGSLTNDIGNKVQLGNTGQDVYRTFTASNTTIYAAMVVNVSAAATGDYFFILGNSTSPATYGSKIYIRSDGSGGFNFGVVRGTGAPVYESTARTFGTNYLLVLKYEVVAGSTNDAVKLYVDPSPVSSEPGAASVEYNAATGADISASYPLSSVGLYQGTAGASPTLEMDNIYVASTWAGITTNQYDYGDAPNTFNNTKDGVFAPAVHKTLSGLRLGASQPDEEPAPASVTSPNDNNSPNGDGADEDGIDVSTEILKKGVYFSITIPVNNLASTTSYLYGWIDFNNNGVFELSEAADAVKTITTAGSSTQVLAWAATKSASIPDGIDKLYLRLRLSNRSLIDFTTAASGGALIDERSVGNGAASTTNAADHAQVASGEIEDFQIDVTRIYDFGDLPISFENDLSGSPRHAIHADGGLVLGNLVDLETEAPSVTSPQENNGAGDNANGQDDEDALTSPPSVIKNVAYSITVPVKNPTAATAAGYLYAWLDLNADGKFTPDELASTGTGTTGSIAIGATANRTLTWSNTQTNIINAGATNIYLRIRISSVALVDFTSGANNALVDERALGNGATSASNSANAPTVSLGEVEDYQLDVNEFDFGDLPVAYENSLAARQISVPTRRIGAQIDYETAAASVDAGLDNNSSNGDGEDEDGLDATALPVIKKGAPFTFSVPVTVSSTSQLIAWIDFNGNGQFELSEAAYTAATGSTQGYRSVAAGTSNQTIYFRGSQTNLITGSHAYLRIRLTATAGADNAATTAIDERSIGDGLSGAVYGTPLEGEVEDYQLEVTTDLDYGDAPTSYESNNAAAAVPARQYTTDDLFLGNAYGLESNPSPVTAPADNNGANGDGEEEDGLAATQLYIRTGSNNIYTVTVNNSTGASATLYAWIDLNNNGRFEAGEAATAVTVANGATTANITFTAAQVNSIAVDKVYMRLRLLQPNTDGAIGDNTGTTAVDERSIADGISTGAYTTVSPGEIEDYQLTIIKDFGDAPASYENGDPASQTNSSESYVLTLGNIIDFELAPASVTTPADNNTTNGDGADEDAVTTPQTITKGAPFVLQVPVTIGQTLTAGTKYLYGWIDLDGDGEFDVNEQTQATFTNTAAGSLLLTLTWSSAQTNTLTPAVITAGKTYVRLRLSAASIANAATGAARDQRSYGKGNADGEIEDYQLLVTDNADFGDAPAGYENDRTTPTPLSVPARQAPSANLKLGNNIPDVENPLANAVTAPASNNGANGDGPDEDGVLELIPVYDGIAYSVKVSVFNNSGAARTLHGWIDFNNNGRFENTAGALEYASVNVPASATQQTVTLTWTAAQTSAIPALTNNLYMRLRITDGASVTDNATGTPGTLVDERAIGDGLSTGAYGTLALGEIEDYQLQVITDFDYGDNPASYDNDRTTPTPLAVPARQAISQALYLGQLPADAEATAQHSANADGDNILAVNDEDAATPGVITRGGGYVLNVSVTNTTGSARTLHAWIDFNNNGRFENTGTALEYTSVSVPSSANPQTVTLTWSAAQSNGIPDPATPAQLHMRLRITAGAVADLTAGANNDLVDERAIGDGLSTGAYAALPSIGEVEDFVIPVSTNYDYGDAPASYENGLPARNISSALLQIGGTPDVEAAAQNVAANTDNNGTNGDGTDEDGIDPSLYKVKPNTVFSLPVRVTNTSGTTRSLMGWIDFNNNGTFEDAEAATFANVATGTIDGTATLTWTAAQSRNVNAAYLYMRLRFINAAATNNAGTSVDERAYADGDATAVYLAGPRVGEIEDYRLEVNPSYDFGDVPATYEDNDAAATIPARHQPASTLFIGSVYDTEATPQNVAAGANNNNPNGDGDDEDGITMSLPALIPGGSYSIAVNVFKSITGTGTLHGWIDLNNDGRFSAGEYASVAVTAATGAQTATITWSATPYGSVQPTTYMRLRFTTTALADNAATPAVDERSIGDGLNTGLYGTTPPSGEVEDYIIPVDETGTIFPIAECGGLGSMDPIQAGFHATIVRPASGGYLIFGENTHGDGVTNLTAPTLLVSGSNGFNFIGDVRMLTTGSSLAYNQAQYFILTTAGLYAWGTEGRVVAASVTSGTAMQPISLPPGISPAQVKMIDAGSSYYSTGGAGSYSSHNGSLALLTTGGQVWIRSSVNSANTTDAFNAVQGDGNLLPDNSSTGWHLVQTSAGVPLTGILDVRTTGAVALATDGVKLYTWGRNMFTGDGTAATSLHYATEMTSPAGLSTPVKQIDLGYGSNISASYYVLDQAGVVHVLGNNNAGQLGIGNTVAQPGWTRITQKNEEPETAGNQTDVTSPIGVVTKISSNNHDAFYGRLMLITADKMAYHAGTNNGNISGAVSPTSTMIPTAMTSGNGSTLLQGKITHIEAGGHISVMAKEGSDRYGYVGHTASGSDGCNGCTGSPSEYNFDQTTSTGPLCGIQAFDFGDLDNRYNLKDSAKHEITYAQQSNPLKLGALAADADDGPQVTVDGVENNADGDNIDSRGNDEDAFVSLPEKIPGDYTIAVPLTNNTGSTAYLYGFIDWNGDGAFTSNETVVVPVPSSPSQQVINITWTNPELTPSGICVSDAEQIRSFVRLRLTTDVLNDNTATTTVDERSHLLAGDGEVEDYYLDWSPQSTQLDYSNLPYDDSSPVNWSRASATLPSLDLSATRIWLGDNNNYPDEGCATNQARNGGLVVKKAGGTAVSGSGTTGDPFIFDVDMPSGTFDFEITVNGNGSPANVYWAVWVDANGNGNFTDADDVFTSGVTQHGSPVTVTAPVTILNGGTNTGALNGAIRVAATGQDAGFNKLQNGEVNVVNGEIEDYYIAYLTALPVTLISFDAVKEGRNAKLSWKTAEELNTETYEIERLSGNSNQWITIGKVAAAGNSNSERQYRFTDNNVYPGANFYRLKIIDLDGKLAYSSVRFVDFGNEAFAITLSPNPASDIVTIKGLTGSNRIQLLDISGRLIQQFNSNDPIQKINISYLTKGVYMVRILKDGQVTVTFKLIKG